MQISVLITTYNDSYFIIDAVNSILNQKYENFELIIIDDGSTDNTGSLINSINDERIIYHKIKHVQRSRALNYGLTKCKNEWVALMDADDICHQERLEKEIEVIKKHPKFDIISCWYGIFDSNKLLYINKAPEHDNSIKKSLLLHSVISNPGVIFRKQVIINAGGYDSLYEGYGIEDYSLWLRLLDKATFYNIPSVLIFQRYRSNSASRKNLKQTLEKIYELQEPYIQLYSHILSDNEKHLLFGWREYFYGKKNMALKYWGELRLRILLKPRILFATLTLILPEKYFIKFKELRTRFRFEYLLSFFSSTNKEARETFNEIINNTQNIP